MEYSWPEENVTGLPSLLTRRYVKLATENVVRGVDVYNEKLFLKPNLLFFTLKCSPVEERKGILELQQIILIRSVPI